MAASVQTNTNIGMESHWLFL